MKKLASSLKIGGVLLLLLLFLSPVSLSAEDAETELISILQNYEKITNNLTARFELFDKRLVPLEISIPQINKSLESLKLTSQKRSEQLDSFDKSLTRVEEISQSSEKRIDGLENTLQNMDRDLKRSKAINKLLFGGLVISVGLATIGLLL